MSDCVLVNDRETASCCAEFILTNSTTVMIKQLLHILSNNQTSVSTCQVSVDVIDSSDLISATSKSVECQKLLPRVSHMRLQLSMLGSTSVTVSFS